jgi:hypothetical protein
MPRTGPAPFYRVLALDADEAGADIFHECVARDRQGKPLGAISKAANDGRFRKEPGQKAAGYHAANGRQHSQRHAAERLVRQPFEYRRYGLYGDVNGPSDNSAEHDQPMATSATKIVWNSP